MMDIQAFNLASKRLNPLRRMLADLQLAANQAGTVQQMIQEASERISRLTQEAEGLQAQVDALRAERETVEQGYTQDVAKYQGLRAAVAADYEAQRTQLSTEFAAYQTQVENARAQMEHAHRER